MNAQEIAKLSELLCNYSAQADLSPEEARAFGKVQGKLARDLSDMIKSVSDGFKKS
jgi:hypothetical protein